MIEGLDVELTAETHFVDTHNGAGVTLLESKSNGTLSSRYVVEIKGQRYFMKTFAHSDSCPVASSRQVIKNEIAVEEFLSRDARLQRSFYRGFTEVADHLCLLFEDMIFGRNTQTLAEKISVCDDFSQNYQTEREWQREVVAKNRIPVHEAVSIIQKLTSYTSLFHTLDDSTEGGVIHTDITPSNIMVYSSVQEGAVQQGVTLLDFGIARRKNKSMNVLFNKVRVEGVQGTYYSSFEIPLHNRVYSPHAGDYTLAEPSFDTYQISNLLCLMITGRLIQHWQHKSNGLAVGGGKGVSNESTLQKVLEDAVRASPLTGDSISLPNKKKVTMIYHSLVEILLKGTHPEKEQRYQKADDLVSDLQRLGLPEPKAYSASPRFLPFQDVPREVASYGIIITPKMKPPLHTLVVDINVEGSYATLEGKLQSEGEDVGRFLGSHQFGDVSTLVEIVKAQRSVAMSEKERRYTFWKIFKRWLFAGATLATISVGAYFAYPSVLHSLDSPPEIKKFAIDERTGIISIAVSDSGINDGLEEIILYEESPDFKGKAILKRQPDGSSFREVLKLHKQMCGRDYKMRVQDVGGHVVWSDRLRVNYNECNE